MKELKCKSCGARLKINENVQYVICEYCGSKYKTNEDINLNIKETMKTTNIVISKIVITGIIIFATIFLVVVGIIIFNINSIESMQNQRNEFEIKSFNGVYELYSGTTHQLALNNLLDTIVTNNKTNANRVISVSYNNIDTSTEEEIINIKQSLENKKYQVSMDYNDEGYVSKVKISNIK